MNKTELVGWLGVGLIVAAYMAVTFQLVAPTDLLYGLMNGAGAIGLIISSLPKRDFQPVVLNIVWLTVAVIGMITSLVF